LVEEIDVEISRKKGLGANNAGDGPRNGGMKRAVLRKHKLSNDTFNMKKRRFESRPVYKHVWSRKACGNYFSNEECGVCYSSEECGEYPSPMDMMATSLLMKTRITYDQRMNGMKRTMERMTQMSMLMLKSRN
jgi:hypothetical protein